MTVEQRHRKTDKTLNRVAQKLINSPRTKSAVLPLAKKHGVSSQTILNYLYGMGSDGFLKEALISDITGIKK